MSKDKNSNEYSKEYFQSNKDYHFNFDPPADEYLVSSGSLYMDYILGGGLGAGLHRFCGANEGGKTNAALHIMFNMLNSVKNSKGLFVMAEGRLNKEIKERSGIKFVYSPEEWVSGTCLVFQCCVQDVVVDYLRGLLRNNKEKEKFCIVIDSMDGLIPKGDLEKTSSEARKVAAGALMTSDFLKRVSLGMSKFGHMCIMISQIRSSINTGPYAKQDPNNQTNSSGGNAILHYPDWIFEFRKRRSSDKFLENPSATIVSVENKPIGHIARVSILKSTNETTGQIVEYPIKYGRKNGRSIWVEKELLDVLLMWGFLERKGAWINLDKDLIDFAKEEKLNLPEKFQGTNKLAEMLEQDINLVEKLKGFVYKNILNK
jgi:RecA/RadA recombinase